MSSLKKNSKKVFISSTVYDNEKEREIICSLLENFDRVPGIRFDCYLSNHPNFPISPNDRTTKHAFDICLVNVRCSDYFILLLKNRYGEPAIENNGDKISITHMEFRTAHRNKIPR
ncbi:MAG: DUF4062 domain-containing protein, partial [Deltaproteobacteria bacterium]|nr:DUF4062 domain-containing protein [Deltaproteobacteria bacterium]